MIWKRTGPGTSLLVLLELGAGGKGAQSARDSLEEALSDDEQTNHSQGESQDGGGLAALDVVNQLVELRDDRVHVEHASEEPTAGNRPQGPLGSSKADGACGAPTSPPQDSPKKPEFSIQARPAKLVLLREPYPRVSIAARRRRWGGFSSGPISAS